VFFYHYTESCIHELMHRPGGFCHLHLRRVGSQNCFFSPFPKSWAAPHDTSLISIDVTHRRAGQGRGDICLSLFFLLFWSLGRGINRLLRFCPLRVVCTLSKVYAPRLLLGAWSLLLLMGARVAGWDWEGGGTCLSLHSGFMRYGLSALFASHSELLGLWAFAFSGTTVPNGNISDIASYNHRRPCYFDPR
jgi:hypothetical protein